MEATLVLGVLACLVHGEDFSLGEGLLSLLGLTSNFLDGSEGWVEVAGTDKISGIEGINPSLRTIEEVGGQSKKGKKTLTKAEVFPMYKACKDSKHQGGFHDFVEILKLYDKNNDNTMIGN